MFAGRQILLKRSQQGTLMWKTMIKCLHPHPQLGTPALHLAITKKRMEFFHILFEEARVNVNVTDKVNYEYHPNLSLTLYIHII